MTKFVFTVEERERLLANLFPASHASVEPIEEFYWHSGRTACDTHLPHSSQALAIDLFGTLHKMEPDTRNIVLGQIAKRIGVPHEGPWEVELEWMDDPTHSGTIRLAKDDYAGNILNERRLTQVDAKAESPYAVILFEAKFGESDGGACSQPFLTKEGLIQCSGNYEMQLNPKNGVANKCALTGKGIRYWEVVPKVMTLDASADHTPCPFKGPWYQWMRNLTLAYEYAQARNKLAAFAVVYADDIRLPFPRTLHSASWKNFVQEVKTDKIALSTMSYQEVCSLAVADQSPQRDLLLGLQQWINSKIARTYKAC